MSAAEQTSAHAVALSVVYTAEDPGSGCCPARDSRWTAPTDAAHHGRRRRHPQIRRRVESAGALVVDTLPEFRALLRRMAAKADV